MFFLKDVLATALGAPLSVKLLLTWSITKLSSDGQQPLQTCCGCQHKKPFTNLFDIIYL